MWLFGYGKYPLYSLKIAMDLKRALSKQMNKAKETGREKLNEENVDTSPLDWKKMRKAFMVRNE